MKKTTKVLVLLLLIGIGGTAIMMGFIVGTGHLMSHEAAKEYAVEETFSELKLDMAAAQINIIPSEKAHVTAYAKAWLPKPIDMNDVVDVRVENGVLTVTETPFPSTFLGVFPQPYELILTIYMPREICDIYQEETDK